jgi:UDP-N-acetylmuramyl pentapeptide synthase
VGPAHLERFGSVQRVAAEKASLLGALADGGRGVVWADSEPLDRALRCYDVPLVRFGASAAADLRLTGYEPTADGGHVEVNGRLRFLLPVPGRHNALNALAAMAAAGRLGVPPAEAAAALESFRGVDMRMQRETYGPVTVFNDAYNANPASLAAAAAVLAATPARRRVAIVGDMRELGDAAEELHRQAGRDLAAAGLDLVIGVGVLGRLLADGAAEAGAEAEPCELLEQARAALGRLLRPGDVVLLKGSRAMRMERLLPAIREAFATDEGEGREHAAPSGMTNDEIRMTNQ